MELTFAEINNIVNMVNKCDRVVCVKEEGELMVYLSSDNIPANTTEILIASRRTRLDPVVFLFKSMNKDRVKLGSNLLIITEELGIQVKVDYQSSVEGE